MNKTLREGESLATEVMQLVSQDVIDDVHVVLIPPFTHLTSTSGVIEFDANMSLGAQNCSEHDSGAFTGEVSASMLESAGVSHVIIGHSERREYFNESDEVLAAKVNKVLGQNMTPIFCCGESLETREGGKHQSFVSEQIEAGLFHLTSEEIQKVVIAYEPIWAIGTGVTATADQAQEMHLAIRLMLTDQYGVDVADQISILYGGSVKPDNAVEIFSKPDVDGGLIGGASLNAKDFVDIVKSF